jgi:hypothetical protein
VLLGPIAVMTRNCSFWLGVLDMSFLWLDSRRDIRRRVVCKLLFSPPRDGGSTASFSQRIAVLYGRDALCWQHRESTIADQRFKWSFA